MVLSQPSGSGEIPVPPQSFVKHHIHLHTQTKLLRASPASPPPIPCPHPQEPQPKHDLNPPLAPPPGPGHHHCMTGELTEPFPLVAQESSFLSAICSPNWPADDLFKCKCKHILKTLTASYCPWNQCKFLPLTFKALSHQGSATFICHPIPSYDPWCKPTILFPKCTRVLPRCGPLHRLFPLLRTLCSPVFPWPKPPGFSDLSSRIRPPRLPPMPERHPPQSTLFVVQKTPRNVGALPIRVGRRACRSRDGLTCSQLFPQCLEQRLMPSWCSASLLSIEQLNHSSRRYPGGPGVVLSPQGNVRKPGQRPEAR